ncbi:hypothetical protein HMPREF0542_10063 [Ligilactobacillus ruminis ATCC 25644]|uniref:Uncharacterized protein n=1 Tax=Ligilactobacillus ruminis ATCC 25644 TaxID=525362 RepID=E7FMD6_9LACO|nr:hypothetical protein HMPREF0542_10063 [Ligilactobacillus ruminis ATCC 25644]
MARHYSFNTNQKEVGKKSGFHLQLNEMSNGEKRKSTDFVRF